MCLCAGAPRWRKEEEPHDDAQDDGEMAAQDDDDDDTEDAAATDDAKANIRKGGETEGRKEGTGSNRVARYKN
jgi:hypothetical protein